LDVDRDDDSFVAAAPNVPAIEPALMGAAQPEPAHEAAGIPSEPTLADLRSIVELNPDDWESRRRLAEALLEEGDRHGGLAELEGAMFALERNGDLRGATEMVNEMIRVEPHAVRYHQKRVEYAVRSNDRSLLAEAYYSLAENLFQMGEIEKSRAVYARVLELSPGDPRARAALQTIDDAQDQESPTESTPEEAPEQTVDQAPPREDPALARSADHTTAELAHPAEERPPARLAADEVATELPLARGREPEPAPVARDFVNLAEWLEEDAPVRNTRMIVDVKEPEIEEQVDFAEMLSMFKQGVAANVDEADHEAHYDLGVAYKEMGLIDEAISEFQKALRGTEKRARTYEALGQCFVERGQHQIAVTILSRALGDKSYTDDMLVGVLYLLGYASESLGRWADAQRFYERVFAVDIEFRDVADRLAVAERAGK
jgi:tetratricopeptide (TPR) repeat protein